MLNTGRSKDMQEYLTAKQTVEHILGMDRKKKKRSNSGKNVKRKNATDCIAVLDAVCGCFFHKNYMEHKKENQIKSSSSSRFRRFKYCASYGQLLISSE